jgi:hypothetical protein
MREKVPFFYKKQVWMSETTHIPSAAAASLDVKKNRLQIPIIRLHAAFR